MDRAGRGRAGQGSARHRRPAFLPRSSMRLTCGELKLDQLSGTQLLELLKLMLMLEVNAIGLGATGGGSASHLRSA